jgi:hypothetical protein
MTRCIISVIDIWVLHDWEHVSCIMYYNDDDDDDDDDDVSCS